MEHCKDGKLNFCKECKENYINYCEDDEMYGHCGYCDCNNCSKDDKNYKDCINLSYGDSKEDPFWLDCGICMNMKCNQCLSCDKGPDCENFDCNHCVNFKAV